MIEPRYKILYLLQLPPPVHGVSTINSLIYKSDRINKNIEKHLVEIKFSDTLTQLRKFSIGKLKSYLQLHQELKSTISSIRPDFVYFSIMPVGKGFFRDLLLVRVIKKSGAIPIYHLHNRGIHIYARKRIFKQLYRYVYNNSNIIHLSENLLETEILPLDLKNSKTFVLPNTSPDERLNESLNERIAGTGVTKLLFVSNLFPAKGIYQLPVIIKTLRENNLDVKLRIIGEAMRKRYYSKLDHLIDSYNLRDHIELIGPKYGSELAGEYNQADIFIFPSIFDQECAPLVILTAMQYGLPVVSNKIGSIPEIIEHGVHGLLADPLNVEDFSNQLEWLIKNTDQQMRIGLEAKKHFESEYSKELFEIKLRAILTEHIMNEP